MRNQTTGIPNFAKILIFCGRYFRKIGLTRLPWAWGRERFAEQSTLTRTLDSFSEANVNQLRGGSEALLHRVGRVFQHNFGQTWLWLDIDLTPLPISKLAEASTKGKFVKKTAMGGNSRGSMRRNITKLCSRICILANRIVVRPIFPSWIPWKLRWA